MSKDATDLMLATLMDDMLALREAVAGRHKPSVVQAARTLACRAMAIVSANGRHQETARPEAQVWLLQRCVLRSDGSRDVEDWLTVRAYATEGEAQVGGNELPAGAAAYGWRVVPIAAGGRLGEVLNEEARR